jgi:hypothetical protein
VIDVKCPPIKELVSAMERGNLPQSLQDHVAGCTPCGELVSSLRDESEGLTISIADLWVHERISCPHPDIMLGYATGSLDPEQASYVDFHLNVIGCPRCQSHEAQAAEALNRRGPAQLDDARRKSLSQTATFLKDLKKSPRIRGE